MFIDLKTSLLFLFAYFICEFQQNKIDHENKFNLDAANCLIEIALKNFYKESKLLVVVDGGLKSDGEVIENYVLKELHAATRWNIQMSNGMPKYFESSVKCTNDENGNRNETLCNNIFRPQYKPGYYLVFTESWQHFSQISKNLTTFKKFNARAMFLTYLSTNTNYKRSVRKILGTYWKFNIFKSVVVVPKNATVWEMYAFNIYAPSKICVADPRLIVLNQCHEGKLQDNLNLYDQIIRTNLEQCTLEVITTKYPPFVIDSKAGFEMELLNEIVAQLNASVNVEFDTTGEDWDEQDEDDNWTGKLSHVVKRSSIGIGNVMADMKIHEYFDLTTDYFNEELVWVVPKAERAPQWKCIIVIFSPGIWMLNLGIILICATLIYLFSKSDDGLKNYHSIDFCLLTSLQTFVGSSVFREPKPVIARTVFVSLAIYSIIISCVYQCYLIDLLTNPLYERQISTEDDIINSNLAVGGIDSYRDIFNSTSDPNSLKFYDRYRIVDNDIDDTAVNCLEDVSAYRNTCAILGRFYVTYLLSQDDPLVSHNGKQKIYILKKKLFVYPIKMIVPKGFFLLDIFNDLINKFLSYGLMHKWTEDYVQAIRKYHVLRNDDGTAEQLNLDHTQGAFAVLLVGYICGVTFFILEMCVKKIQSTSWWKLHRKEQKQQKIGKSRLLEKSKTARKFVE